MMADLVTLANVKEYLWPGETITTWDTILPSIISAVSEQIEREVGSHLDMAIYTATAVLSFVVYYTAGVSGNGIIDFDEGGVQLTGTVMPGTYTGATLATAIAAAMNAAVGKTFIYTCAYSTTIGKFTIAAGSTFTIRWNTGSNTGFRIAALCGFPETADSTGAKTYTGYRVGDEAKASGCGSSFLYLPNWPIVSVISVVDKDGVAYVEGDDEAYVISPGPSHYALQLNDGTWEKGTGNFTVRYIAGYATVPADIVLVAYEAIARKWKTMKEQGWGESGRTMPDGSTSTVNADGALTKSQREILARYKRPIL
jgi:hypothetical protein